MKNTALKRIFRDSRRKLLTEYYTIDKSQYCGKATKEECTDPHCCQTVQFTDPALLMFSQKIFHRTMEEDMKSMLEKIAATYEYTYKGFVKSTLPDPGTLFAIRTAGTNVTCCDPPIRGAGWPGTEGEVYHLSPEIESIVKRADRLHILRRTGTILVDDAYASVFSQTSKPSTLAGACLQQFPLSMWHIAFGKTDGQPHWTNRGSNLYPTKIVDITSKHAQNRHKHKPEAEELLPLYSVAHDYLFHRLGTSRFVGKMQWGLDIEGIQGRALHAAAGVKPGRREEHVLNEFTRLKITPSGKKFENHVQDLQSWIDYLSDPTKPFPTYWKLSVKNEIVVHPGKRMTPEQAEANAVKGRTFCTPGSEFAAGEILVGQRMKLERGEWISIGHVWGAGGADKIAQSLRVVSIEDGFQEMIQEADVTGLDHVIYGRDTDLYFANGLVYDRRDHPDHEARRFITEYLIANLLCRQTQIMSDVWAFIRGEVPSGLQNTSHMDSWQMAFWFILFVLRRAFDPSVTPEERKKILDALSLHVICIILYGDDHLYTVGMDPVLKAYFNIVQFKEFLQKYYGVELRDCRKHVTFLSIEKNGTLVHKGACYLKHYFVINPAKDEPRQPLFLPYRESNEVLAKAIVGREIKGTRTPLDIAMSCIGHAYGTYASNRDAYDRLKCLYETCMLEIKDPEAVVKFVQKNSDHKTIRNMNRMGISLTELYLGFPTWDALKKKNEVDYERHVTKLWAGDSLAEYDTS